MTILQRRSKSGFIPYPKAAEKRVIDGSARFRTKCDMLVGPCACGGVHQENDRWVYALLDDYDLNLETLNLQPDKNGMIFIPRYWIKTPCREDCSSLHGTCSCGKYHYANERWVRDMLEAHNTYISGCPEASLPTIGEPDSQEEMASGECGCGICCRHRRQENTLRRGEI